MIFRFISKLFSAKYYFLGQGKNNAERFIANLFAKFLKINIPNYQEN
jgi:hypothetical protein